MQLPFSRQFRYRVLVVGIGVLLLAITFIILLAPVSPWWAAPSAFYAFGWWSDLIKAWVGLVFDPPGDSYRHRPGDDHEGWMT
jgi:hypothetical protein